MALDMEKQMREQLRWTILQTLDAARPLGANEDLISKVLQDVEMPQSRKELRKQLDYLAERELITIEGKETPVWICKLTRYGIDIVEYTIPCEPGIARPKKYWD